LDKIIVIGIGNVLMCDEGVGVRVAEKLMAEYAFPANVEVYDGGTTGMHGLMPLIEEADRLIVIDAVNGPGEPGELYRYTLDDFKLNIPKKLSAHDIGFIECMAIAGINERSPASTVIIGVKPADIGSWEMRLTGAVAARVEDLMRMVVDELESAGAPPAAKKA